MNNLPKVVTQQRRGWASNPRLLDRKSDALPLSHRATLLSQLSWGVQPGTPPPSPLSILTLRAITVSCNSVKNRVFCFRYEHIL